MTDFSKVYNQIYEECTSCGSYIVGFCRDEHWAIKTCFVCGGQTEGFRIFEKSWKQLELNNEL